MTKQIPLTNGMFATVDEEDYESLLQFKWFALRTQGGKYVYAATKSKKIMLMHRVILGPPEGMVIDHINHDTLDNRRINLRSCTHGQNMQNRMIHKNNKSGYKGVRSRGNKFSAEIRANGKLFHIGRFNTAQEASAAYSEAASRLHGEFAKTTFGI